MAGYLVDTNVLLRLLQEESDQYDLVFGAMDKLGAGGDVVFITPQVVIEFWSAATRPVEVNGFGWDVELASARVRDAMRRFPLLEDCPAIVHLWLEFVHRYGVKGKRTHDTRLVAVMQAHGVENLLTFNVDDFAAFKEINAVHPASVK